MRQKQMILMVVGAMMGLVTARAGTGQQEMQPAVAFPHAGVRMSIPKGFEFIGTVGPREVTTAVRKDGEKAIQSVTLAVCLEAVDGTAAKLADYVRKEIDQALDVRGLVVEKDTPRKVAGQEALVRQVRYTSRGRKMTAITACWLRPSEEGKTAIGYALTATSFADKADGLGEAFEAAVDSVLLTPLWRPTELPIEALAEPIASPGEGYSLRRPHGWFRIPMGQTLTLAQWDCQADNETVRAWVISQPSPQGTTAKQRAQAVMATKAPNVVSTVVSQGAAGMAGREGYQFIVRLSPGAPSSRPAGEGSAPAQPLVVQRVLCVRGAGKEDRCFTLFLFYQGADVQAASAMMDKIASGFTLLPGPPASAPAADDQ